MASPVPQQVIDAVTAADTVIDSATTFIGGVAAMIQTAVTAALANGATAAELQPVSDVVVTLNAKKDALAAAIAANTPGAP